MNVDEINTTLKRFTKLNKLMSGINKSKELYSYPYKNIGIMEEEYNFWGVLNSSDKNWKLNLLSRIEFLINELKELYSDDIIKRGLMNNPFSFKSELEFAFFCKNNGIKILEIEPELKTGKKLDLLIQINSIDILVEVITPRQKAEMIIKNVGFFPISGEIEYNLSGEFDNHKIVENYINQPFLIAINPIYSGTNEIEISCAIEEFNKKFKDISHYLWGIVFMSTKKYNVLTSEEIGVYQFFKNPQSEVNLDLKGIFSKKIKRNNY